MLLLASSPSGDVVVYRRVAISLPPISDFSLDFGTRRSKLRSTLPDEEDDYTFSRNGSRVTSATATVTVEVKRLTGHAFDCGGRYPVERTANL